MHFYAHYNSPLGLGSLSREAFSKWGGKKPGYLSDCLFISSHFLLLANETLSQQSSTGHVYIDLYMHLQRILHTTSK